MIKLHGCVIYVAVMMQVFTVSLHILANEHVGHFVKQVNRCIVQGPA